MPTCKKCQTVFPNLIEIDGHLRDVSKRSFCIDCSPFGSHNTRDLTIPVNNTTKKCNMCGEVLPLEKFHQRRDKAGVTPYCKPCTNKQSTVRQQKLKADAVAYKGGKCFRCGYSKYIGALEFHHLDKTQKDFSISQTRQTTFARIKTELDKCVLVCANCHREIHAEQRLLD